MTARLIAAVVLFVAVHAAAAQAVDLAPGNQSLALDLPDAARALETTNHGCWSDGLLTRDLTPDVLGTDEVTDEVCKRLV